MNTMYKFYACYWSPNGTNDLIITDTDNKIVDTIDEALYGVRVFNDGWTCDDTSVFKSDSSVGEGWQCLKRIEPCDLRRFVACSPVDPKGERVLSQLVKYMEV